MKTTTCYPHDSKDHGSLEHACVATGEKLTKRIRQAKHELLAEFTGLFQAHQQLLRQAITEADALAWQTDYPHLLFPALAAEKVQKAAQWQARQEAFLAGRNWPVALAA